MRVERNGFTLVEMMIALLILGLISAAGIALLSYSASNREAVRASSEAAAAMQRTRQLLKADLGQVVGLGGQAAPVGGETAPDAAAQPLPLSGGGFPGFLTVTRYVGAGPDGAPNAPLQRIEYLFDEGRLERVAYASWRGDRPLNRQVLLTDLRTLEVKFVSYGVTSSRWPASGQRLSPDAVVITLDSARFGRMEQWFLVGSGPA